MKTFFNDSRVIHFCGFMLWNKSDYKKCGFVLVLYLSRDINYFKSEKVIPPSYHVKASFINKKDK